MPLFFPSAPLDPTNPINLLGLINTRFLLRPHCAEKHAPIPGIGATHHWERSPFLIPASKGRDGRRVSQTLPGRRGAFHSFGSHSHTPLSGGRRTHLLKSKGMLVADATQRPRPPFCPKSRLQSCRLLGQEVTDPARPSRRMRCTNSLDGGPKHRDASAAALKETSEGRAGRARAGCFCKGLSGELAELLKGLLSP